MKYNELTISEKNELKEKLFFESITHDGYTDFDYLCEEDQNRVLGCSCPSEIPEDIMESAYDIYEFTEEDFFCNTEDQFCDRLGNLK